MSTLPQNGNFLSAADPWHRRRSGVSPTQELGAEMHPQEVLAQLSRMLDDDLFVRSERLSRFLRFIVEQTLDGRARDLNQYAVGLAVFDKSATFDPNIDPIVRVEAGRLRAKLREYYATSGQTDSVRIGMSKSGYRPFFKRWQAESAPLQPDAGAIQGIEGSPVRARAVRETAPSPRDARISIAVLPFSNLSRDAASNQFCRELSHRLSKELVQLTSFVVRVVAPLAGAEENSPEIREIGRRYNAAVVLEGSVQTVGKDVRIFSMLARTADACGIWAESYDGSFDDLCADQSKTLRAIAADVTKVLQCHGAKLPVAVS